MNQAFTNTPLDDDKYTAHTALLGRSIRSASTLQLEDKALFAPRAVISSIAGNNGQNCFAYKGKCLQIDDTNSLQNACGSGFTVVGWDDAGCGSKKCVCPNVGWDNLELSVLKIVF